MIVPIPPKPLQRTFINSNQPAVFNAQPTTTPSAASGPPGGIFQQGGGNFFLNQQTKLNTNNSTTVQMHSNNSPLGQGQSEMSFNQSGNMGHQGILGQQPTANSLSALAGGLQNTTNSGTNPFGLSGSTSQNSQQPNFLKGGLFHQPRPGENNSRSQVSEEKVNHGQYTALSFGLFGQSLSQASNPLGVNNQNGPNKPDGNASSFVNQQSSIFPINVPNYDSYQAYFDSAQKKPTGGFTIDPKQTEFTLPSILSSKETPVFPKVKPIRSKNSKLTASELVLCISAYE